MGQPRKVRGASKLCKPRTQFVVVDRRDPQRAAITTVWAYSPRQALAYGVCARIGYSLSDWSTRFAAVPYAEFFAPSEEEAMRASLKTAAERIEIERVIVIETGDSCGCIPRFVTHHAASEAQATFGF